MRKADALILASFDANETDDAVFLVCRKENGNIICINEFRGDAAISLYEYLIGKKTKKEEHNA